MLTQNNAKDNCKFKGQVSFSLLFDDVFLGTFVFWFFMSTSHFQRS